MPVQEREYMARDDEPDRPAPAKDKPKGCGCSLPFYALWGFCIVLYAVSPTLTEIILALTMLGLLVVLVVWLWSIIRRWWQ